MGTIAEYSPAVGVAPLCRALDVPRATLYRVWQREQKPVQSRPRPKPARTLSDDERQEVLDVLHEPRFVDQPPAQVYATLLDEERYLCLERTMYRILDAQARCARGATSLSTPPSCRSTNLAAGKTARLITR
jgi:putative transposase